MVYRNRMKRVDVPITHRPGRAPDAPALARMARDYVEDGLPWTWRERRILRAIHDPETMVLIAEAPRGSGAEVTGYAIMRFGDETAHLSLLAVRPAYRRRGIARGLLEWLEASARTAGVREVGLEVRADNHAARRLYRGLGYREVAHLPGYYDGREAAYRMTARLLRENRERG